MGSSDIIPDANRVGDALLRPEDESWAQSSDFSQKNTVILIHGFTANGKYLLPLANYLNGMDFRALLFSYNSYRGIEAAAISLEHLLVKMDLGTQGSVRKNRIFLVAHSMGGLVARAFAVRDFGRQVVRGLSLFGTPNNGTLTDAEFLNHLIDYGESISEAMPYARNAACRSAQELTKSDGSPPFIDRLNAAWNAQGMQIPIRTISGGKNHLEFGRNALVNWFINRTIQKQFDGAVNDGLVSESSSDISNVLTSPLPQHISHFKNYPEYSDMNHSYMIANQSLALEVAGWFRELMSHSGE